MVKRHRLLVPRDQPLVDNVEHLQKGAFRGDVACVDLFEAAFGRILILSPESEMKIHDNRGAGLFIATGRKMDGLVMERLFDKVRFVAIALEHPGKDFGKFIVMTQGLTISGLVLGAEMSAA